MERDLIVRVVAEMNSVLTGMRLRSITQIGKYSYVFTFEGEIFRHLLISIEPREPRIYLIRRRDRDLKKLAAHRSLFAIATEKSLGRMTFGSAEMKTDERIAILKFGADTSAKLVVQLTGISSNLFVLNERNEIAIADRSSSLPGQSVGTTYSRPSDRIEAEKHDSALTFLEDEQSVSEALDEHFLKIDDEADFNKRVELVRSKNRRQIKKAEKLMLNLENDLIEHGDAEKWKRFGDLLLASQGNADRLPGIIEVVDVFEETQPTIGIEADDNDSLPEAAQKYFRRYAKARNAKSEVQARIEKARVEIEGLRKIEMEIQNAFEQHDAGYFTNVTISRSPTAASKPKTKKEKQLSGIRTYVSSDGFEILVGKKATDNDFLTQRVAHSRDTWMHAADYPGSHVVIRNANRKEIPHRTLVEAARLAAFFSQGNKQTRAAVNYTEKKFVSKPKGSAPGLVRLSSFKTLLVEPTFPAIEKKD